MKIDLSPYCPVKQFQIGGTCYAYAVAYTAYSTQYNLTHNISGREIIENNAFSYFYVASIVRRDYLHLIRRLADRNCSWRGTAEHSLTVLRDYGCTKISEKDFQCQDGVSYEDVQLGLKNKITSFSIITRDFDTSKNGIKSIVDQLRGNKPVVVAVNSTTEFHEISTSTSRLTVLEPYAANHVVAILGFDESLFENEGAFLIKNNYPNWGDDGFCWIHCTDMMHLIDESYTITI